MTGGPAARPAPDPMRAYFDDEAAYWEDVYRRDDLQSHIYRERQAAVLELLDAFELPRGTRLLEIGCGAGFLTVELAGRGYAVHAVDISPEMVARTRERARSAGATSVTTEVAPADVLPFPDRAFDAAVAVGVLPWLPMPAAAVAEAARVLAAGAPLVLTADNRARLTAFTNPRGNPAYVRFARARRGGTGSGAPVGSRLHFPVHVDDMLRAAGMKPVARRTVGFGPFTVRRRALLSEPRAIALHRSLQRLADAGVPGLRGTGWHYLVAASKAA